MTQMWICIEYVTICECFFEFSTANAGNKRKLLTRRAIWTRRWCKQWSLGATVDVCSASTPIDDLRYSNDSRSATFMLLFRTNWSNKHRRKQSFDNRNKRNAEIYRFLHCFVLSTMTKHCISRDGFLFKTNAQMYANLTLIQFWFFAKVFIFDASLLDATFIGTPLNVECS